MFQRDGTLSTPENFKENSKKVTFDFCKRKLQVKLHKFERIIKQSELSHRFRNSTISLVFRFLLTSHHPLCKSETEREKFVRC